MSASRSANGNACIASQRLRCRSTTTARGSYSSATRFNGGGTLSSLGFSTFKAACAARTLVFGDCVSSRYKRRSVECASAVPVSFATTACNRSFSSTVSWSFVTSCWMMLSHSVNLLRRSVSVSVMAAAYLAAPGRSLAEQAAACAGCLSIAFEQRCQRGHAGQEIVHVRHHQGDGQRRRVSASAMGLDRDQQSTAPDERQCAASWRDIHYCQTETAKACRPMSSRKMNRPFRPLIALYVEITNTSNAE